MLLTDIPDRLRLMKRPQADLARHLALDPASLTKTLKGTRRVQPAEVLKIEAFFGEKLDVESVAPLTPRRRTIPSKVPVYGYAAAGGDERIAFADDHIIAELEPPPYWSGAGDLIYVRLIGDSMEERFYSGEILPVRLHYPPAKGQDCLIVFSDNTALVKRYEGQRGGRVYARQFNPEQLLDWEATKVRELHTVWRPGMV